MNIPNLKYYNKVKKINLTTNNNTPIKIKRFSYSNSQTSNHNKCNCKNGRNLNNFIDKNFSYNNISDTTQKYIFNNYKVSPLIALLIYEKSINKLFEFIKKSLPINIFIEFKKKYILFVIEELHISDKNIISNLSNKDLINVDIKLFISQKSSYFLNYSKFFDKYQQKVKSNSNSLFQLKKNHIKRGKISSFNSFNTELKIDNKSLINSSKIFVRPKNKIKNVCNTEYINKIDKEKLKSKKLSINEISKLKPLKNKRKNKTNHLKNISLINGSFTNPIIFSTKASKKKLFERKEKVINNEKQRGKIFIKLPINKTKKLERDKINDENKKEEKENNKIEIKDNEKNSIKQLNLIKKNLDDNLKNMFNFSYGYFLNNERESDSSKSIHDLYRFDNNEYNNFKQN